MKRSLLTLIAFAAFSLTAGAQSKKPEAKPAEKAPAEKTADAKEEKTAAKEERAPAKTRKIPFRGAIKEVDAKAKTFIIGKSTYHLTDTSEILNGEKPGTAADVAVGLASSGSYADNNGVKEVVKLTLKVKEEKEAAKDAKKEEKEADKTTAPSEKKPK